MSRQATLDALGAMPQQIWLCYLMAIRGMNLVVADIVMDDPSLCDDLEDAIKKELDVKS